MEIAGIDLETLDIHQIGTWPVLLRRILLAAICMLILALGHFFILQQAVGQWQFEIQELEKAKKMFSDTQDKVKNLDMYKEEIKSITKELGVLSQQLPNKNEEAALLEEISQLAATAGLQFISIKPGKPEDRVFYKESPSELTLRGKFNGMGTFVSNIANMSRIVTIHDIKISQNNANQASTTNNDLVLVLNIKTYWLTAKQSRQ